MPVTSTVRFVGTGKPMTPRIPVRVNREGSQQALRFSSAESFSEFKNINKRMTSTSAKEMGQSTGRAAHKIQSGRKVDLTV